VALKGLRVGTGKKFEKDPTKGQKARNRKKGQGWVQLRGGGSHHYAFNGGCWNRGTKMKKRGSLKLMDVLNWVGGREGRIAM